MIDKHTFAAGMTALSGAFGREIDGPVSAMYYGILSPKLTGAEFQAAILKTCESETFWPSPGVILSKVPRLKEDAGYLAFEHVNRVTSEHGGYRFLPHEVFQREFDAPTRAAIAKVGGLAAIANTNEDRWTALGKRFAAAYQSAVSPEPEAPRLRSANTDAAERIVQDVVEKLDYRRIAAGDR